VASRSDQIKVGGVEAEARDQHMVLATSGPTTRRIEKRKTPSGGEVTFTFEHNSLTDVMFIDIRSPEKDEKVEVIDVGECVGFPGQVQVRVNTEKELFYGMTIQNFSGFKRTLQWRYRMFSVQNALKLFIMALLAGLRIEQMGHRPALCP